MALDSHMVSVYMLHMDKIMGDGAADLFRYMNIATDLSYYSFLKVMCNTSVWYSWCNIHVSKYIIMKYYNIT